jgi:hypothetical protein
MSSNWPDGGLWAAGTGCDATHLISGDNPSIQLKKFDEKVFILGSGFLNLNSVCYGSMVNHAFAREELS